MRLLTSFLLAVICLLSSCTSTIPSVSRKVAGAADWKPAADFWKTWGDGEAEISTYDLIVPRYGEPREGTAALIFVTETFSNQLRLKADPGVHPKSDEYSVMKLNLVRDYQTGVYDYNEMLSSFVALEPINGLPAGVLTKATFSRQEWCGHMFQQLLFGNGKVKSSGFSYFDQEAPINQSLDVPGDALSEDALFHWVRGMALPLLKPGEKRTVPMLISAQSARDSHGPLLLTRATISRSAAPQSIEIEEGTWMVDYFRVEFPNGSTREFYVEHAVPHRIIRWEFSTGEEAELIRSERMKYWQLNSTADEDILGDLGLEPRPPRTM
jgi:hypothetical protein